MKVSVITPSFNQGRFIVRTLRSVATQSGVQIDHFIVDGGSTDNTVDILRNFDGDIRWISEKDKGQTDAVNKGLHKTDGEIIGWLNSDDIYYPDTISQVVALFETHPEIDVVYGLADHIDQNDKAFEAYPSEPWNFARLQDICFICQPATFFRRSVVEKHGYLDDTLRYCMDYEFWLRLGKAGVQFGYLEDKLAGSRLYAENKTLGSRIEVHAEINDVLKRLFGKVPDRWLWNYTHAVVEARFDRSRHPRWFALYMLVIVTTAAWRWNGALSPDIKINIHDLWRRFRAGRS